MKHIPKFHFVFVFIFLDSINGHIQSATEEFQYLNYNYDLSQNSKNFGFAIISKYLPFGSIRQVGAIGLFDSNCLIISNIIGGQTNQVIFLYYDCIDYEDKQITKHIQFIGSDNKVYNYQMIIPNLEYEDQWYCLVFEHSITQKIVQIVILKYPNEIIFYVTQPLIQPFLDQQFKLVAGGGYQIEDSAGIISFNNTKYFSFFSGKIYFENQFGHNFPDEKEYIINFFEFLNSEQCECNSSFNSRAEINLKDFDIISISSEFRNCDKFSVQFWIKFNQIVQEQDEFQYQIFKMNSNTKDVRLMNGNLSPFQLFYKISKFYQNKIIFTTYSYDVPTVNLDFTQNQFLITREYDLDQDLLLSWQSISLNLDEMLQVDIKIYKGTQIILYTTQLQVNHFHEIIFFMQLGNIQKNQYNFINFFLYSFVFDNCETLAVEKICHPSCLECDGPTKDDCITCDETSNRIFLPFYKVCICPYDMIDNGQICQNYDNLQFSFISFAASAISTPLQSCDYGYYMQDNETCVKCPTIVQNTKITCLECILNPNGWGQRSVCNIAYTTDQELSQTYLQAQAQNTINNFDGENVIFCNRCDSGILESINILDIYQNYQEQNTYFKQFCQITWEGQAPQKFPNLNKNLCYTYQGIIQYCEFLTLQYDFTCKVCKYLTTNTNGKCLLKLSNKRKECFAPYYLNQNKQCIKCNIINCNYCFQYQNDDLSQSTLYKDFKGFSNDAQYSVGCALCETGYQYNFITGFCQIQNIQIQSCLRSFINLNNIEICTLSSVLDFSVSLEIICQELIPNCLQCIKTPLNTLQCVLCIPGYCQSLSKNCEFEGDPNSEICLQGDDSAFDNSLISLIQSFMMTFLPNSYYYPIGQTSARNRYYHTHKCKKNFATNSKNSCVPYCNSNCLECQENLTTNEFECKKCPLNYYKKNIVSQFSGKCIECQQLCQFCQPRTSDQIKIINPYFIINESNEKYTYLCLKQINNSNISIDQNLLVAYNFQQIGSIIQYKFFIDDKFKNNPYQTYQDQINVEFCNQMGIKEIQLLFLLQFYDNLKYYIQNDLKSQIFTLQKTSAKLQGVGLLGILENIQVSKFDAIIMEQINSAQCDSFNSEFSNYADQQLELVIQDLLFNCDSDSIIDRVEFNMIAHKLQELYIKNITIINYNILDSSLFNLDFYQSSNQEIFILNIYIQNCNFTNSVIFQLFNLKHSLNVQKIQIENCQLLNSSIFEINSNDSESEIFFEDLKIINSIFVDSITISSPISKLKFTNFTLMQNQFYQSKYISANQDLYLKDTLVIQNLFYKSVLIEIIRKKYNNNINSKIEIINLNLLQNQIFNLQLFQSLQDASQSQQYLTIIFDNMILAQNQKLHPIEDELTLIQIQNATLQAFNIQIINSEQFKYFILSQMIAVSFINITIQNEKNQQTIPSSLNCISVQKGTSYLLNLQELVNFHLENISIINQFTIDSPFIYIASSLQYQFEKQKIVIKNLYFNNNILLKTQSDIILSSIYIYSQKPLNILFENIRFKENCYHQIIDDTSIFSASLIYIDSVKSYCTFQNMNLSSNYLTNSSSSYILINVDEIILKNIIVMNQNVITEDLFYNYYNIKFQELSKDNLQQIFHKIFQIKNIGGVCQLTAQKVTITNGFFKNIRAQSNAICQITTKGQGIVKIYDLSIQKVITDVTLSIILFGGIGIDSFDSLLELEIKNVTFKSNFNKFGSSILTVIPSQTQNKIKIVDVVIKNCISLMNSIFSFEFTGQQRIINNVKIVNLTFSLDESSWIEYFNLIQNINEFDVQKILSSNSIISISGSEVELSNLYISGIILGQILKLINSKKIQVKHMRAQDIQQIYSDDLIFFGQNEQNEEKITLFSNEIKNYSQYFPKNFVLSQQDLIIVNGEEQCQNTNNYFTISNQDKNYSDFINLFLNQSTNIGSIMYFSATSNLTQIKIIGLFIGYNKQHQFSSALNFNLNSFNKVQISDFYCINNKFKKFGCLKFYSALLLNKQITVSNSFFFQNEGLNGSAINSENLNLKIKRCYLMNNTALELGGAINYAGTILVLKNSYVFFNKARIGGGLAISNMQLNFDQLQSFYLQLNYASFASDNILSQPTHLSSQINNFQIPSEIVQFQNQSFYQLEIKPYITIEQERKIATKYLMLPTNQIISDYYLLEPHNLQHFKQIFSIKITLRNIYDEILPNLNKFVCQVNSGIQSNLQQEAEIEQIEGQLQFDSLTNQFEFDKIKITNDPYQMNGSFLILLTQCSSADYTLNYKIISQIYKCQLGEYYIEKIGCQICNPTQGYYSVTYDATKCSLFDKTKYKNITSNQIELLQGFWRSNKYSDITENCFKNQRFCLGGWNTGNELCKKGNIGGLCEECDIENLRGYGHYFKDTQNKECWDCGNSASGLIGFTLILLWAFLSTFLTLSSIKQSNKQFSSLKSIYKFGKIIYKLSQDHKSFLIKMLINYLWIFSAIFTFNITFSFQVNAVEQVSNPSVFMANSLDCLLWGITDIQITYLRVIVAFLLIFTQFTIIVLISSTISLFKRKIIHNSIFSNTIIYLYLQNNGSIIKQLSSLLAQRSISGVSYISGDVSMLYNVEKHFNWLKYFILPSLVIFVLIIPIILLLLLFINRNKLIAIKVRKHLGYLFDEYKDEKYFWELVKILKQSIIIVFLIMFETQIFIKATVIGFILILYQLFVAQQEPFALKNFNKLDLQSGQLCSVGMFLGALKYQTEQEKNYFLSELLQILIIFLLLRICFPFISKLLKILIQNEKLQILRGIIRTFSWIQKQSSIVRSLSNYLDKLERNKKNFLKNIGKIRQSFLKSKTKLLTLEQRLSPSTTFTLLSPQNTQNQRLQMDQHMSLQKIEI